MLVGVSGVGLESLLVHADKGAVLVLVDMRVVLNDEESCLHLDGGEVRGGLECRQRQLAGSGSSFEWLRLEGTRS